MNTAFQWQPIRPTAMTAGTSRRAESDAPLFLEAKRSILDSVAFGLCCLFVLAIPWENALVLPEVGTISRLLGLIAFPASVLAIPASGRLRRLSTPLVLMGLFVAWGSLSYLWTIDTEVTSTLIISWLQNLVMVWLIWELGANRERQLMLMRAYLLGTLVSASDTLLSYLRGIEAHYQRYAGSGFDPNDLGVLLALSLPISLYLAAREGHKRVVWIYRLQQVMVVLAIGLTSSRAALVAMAVALLYLPLASTRITFRQRCALLLLVAIGGGCMLAVLPESTWKRWGGIAEEMEQGTWSARKLIWSVGLELFEERPILGVGAGNFPIAAQQVAPPIGAHNTFLSILVEEGLVGFGLFLLLLLSLVLPALRLPVLERYLWLIVLATWSAGVMTLTWENRKATWFLFGLLAAWLASNPAPMGMAHGLRSPERCAAHMKPRLS